MKLIALVASLFLFVWIVGVMMLTWHNLSRFLFGINEAEPRVRFWMREIVIILWPLVLASAEGRHALKLIWTGKDDSHAEDDTADRTIHL